MFLCNHPWKSKRNKIWTTGSRISKTQKDSDTAGRHYLVWVSMKCHLSMDLTPKQKKKKKSVMALFQITTALQTQVIIFSLENFSSSYPGENYKMSKKMKLDKQLCLIIYATNLSVLYGNRTPLLSSTGEQIARRRGITSLMPCLCI